jgi:hypothetical protein
MMNLKLIAFLVLIIVISLFLGCYFPSVEGLDNIASTPSPKGTKGPEPKGTKGPEPKGTKGPEPKGTKGPEPSKGPHPSAGPHPTKGPTLANSEFKADKTSYCATLKNTIDILSKQTDPSVKTNVQELTKLQQHFKCT